MCVETSGILAVKLKRTDSFCKKLILFNYHYLFWPGTYFIYRRVAELFMFDFEISGIHLDREKVTSCFSSCCFTGTWWVCCWYHSWMLSALWKLACHLGNSESRNDSRQRGVSGVVEVGWDGPCQEGPRVRRKPEDECLHADAQKRHWDAAQVCHHVIPALDTPSTSFLVTSLSLLWGLLSDRARGTWHTF